MSEDLRGRLYTTVVGSFPYRVDKKLMAQEDWYSDSEIRRTSYEALEFQLECGIDFPSDGQFDDMVEMYLAPLKRSGFITEDRFFGEGDLPLAHPVTILDSELEKAAREKGAQGIRVPITGPFTLACRVKNEKGNLAETADREGVVALGKAVESFVKGFERSLSGSILSVDEPVLPFVLSSFGDDFIIDVLNNVFRAIKKNHSCMHVCGGVVSIKDVSLSLQVDILDHEFQGTNNSGVYTQNELESNGKMLSYGVVNSNPRQVFKEDGRVQAESVSDITNFIKKGSEQYGLENLLISPDCGFGGWKSVRRPVDEKWRIIKDKLCNMVAARDALFNNSLSSSNL